MPATQGALPRSASEVRDSLAVEDRLPFVVDSLVDAGEDREEIEETLERLRNLGYVDDER